MGWVVVAAEESIAATPRHVFDLLRTRRASRVLDFERNPIVVGAPVTLRMPLGDHHAGRFDICGHITRVIPARQIVIAHEHPWRGVVRCVLEPQPPCSTLVRLIAHLDEHGIRWLQRIAGCHTTATVGIHPTA